MPCIREERGELQWTGKTAATKCPVAGKGRTWRQDVAAKVKTVGQRQGVVSGQEKVSATSCPGRFMDRIRRQMVVSHARLEIRT